MMMHTMIYDSVSENMTYRKNMLFIDSVWCHFQHTELLFICHTCSNLKIISGNLIYLLQ